MTRCSVIVLLAAILFLGLPAPGLAQESLKIGILPIVEALPFILMEKEGKPENLKIIVFNSALERDAALQGGQLDGAITDPVASAIMAGRGMDVVLASLILGSKPEEGRFAIIAAPGSSIKTPQDLKGVPIAISSNTIVEYVTDSLLTGAGLKDSEIAKEEIKKMPVRFQMLLSGQIQAATLPDPLAHFAQSKGARLIIDDTGGENISQVVLLFTGKAVKEKGYQIEQMYRAYDRHVERINESPDSHRQILVERARLPKPISSTYPLDHFPKAQLPDREAIERVIDWARQKDLIKEPVTFDSLTGRSPLK